jgi:hypothetical protein
MKVLLISAALLFLVQYASATQMSGFAAMYYQDDRTTPEEPTNAPLFPAIIHGKKTIQMEVSHCQISQVHSLKKTVPHTGSAFMTTMARITGSFLITKWVQDC